MLLVLIVPSYTCIFHNCMSKPIFFLTLKVNDARGVLCDITNQNESAQVGHLLMPS